MKIPTILLITIATVAITIAGCTQPLPPQQQENATECTSDSDCGVGGCSGQVCATAEKASGIITTCEYREEYGCLKLTSCGCVNGKCAWRESAEFKSCVDATKSEQQLPQQEQPQ